MRTLFLHIGMHKTGTTSIQNTLAKYLNTGPFVYADMSPYDNHSVAVYTLFSERPLMHPIHQRRKTAASELLKEKDALEQRLVNHFADHPSADFIISGDGIGKNGAGPS